MPRNGGPLRCAPPTAPRSGPPSPPSRALSTPRLKFRLDKIRGQRHRKLCPSHGECIGHSSAPTCCVPTRHVAGLAATWLSHSCLVALRECCLDPTNAGKF